jgi:hypothetical protein
MERAKGIEPSYAAWEAAVLPLNYAREINRLTEYQIPWRRTTDAREKIGANQAAIGNFSESR